MSVTGLSAGVDIAGPNDDIKRIICNQRTRNQVMMSSMGSPLVYVMDDGFHVMWSGWAGGSTGPA